MVWPILSSTPALVPVAAAHGVTLGGLIFLAIPYFGTGITGMVIGHFLTMGQTVACLEETYVCVWPIETDIDGKFSSVRGHLFDQSGFGEGEGLKALGHAGDIRGIQGSWCGRIGNSIWHGGQVRFQAVQCIIWDVRGAVLECELTATG